jgi:voltage-dependent potassium channel beta subunit
MDYRRMGRTGLRLSTVSIGGWLTYGGSVQKQDSFPILHRALDGGINFVDLADIYSAGRAEEIFGAFLKERAGCGFQRSDVVISSKVFWPTGEGPNDRGLSRKHIMESCDKSLRRLGTDYLDLYFCHRFDPEVPLEETVRAMEDLVQSGKVLHWGTSVWEADQLREGMALSRTHHGYGPTVEQPRYNLLDRHIEADILPTCRALGIGLVVWSPLAQGILTGKYNDGMPPGSRGADTQWLQRELTPENLDRVRALKGLARELGTTPAALSLAWLLHQPGITSVITGATSVQQVDENLAAAALRLDDAVVARVGAMFGG